jgi:guanine nucleotide-binding protein subunit alpha, other
MRLIHAGGFKKDERKHWRVVIFNNLVSAFQIILCAMEDHGTDFEDHDNLRFADMVCNEPEITPNDPMPGDYYAAFESLWADKGVQLAILKGNEYALHDNLT